MKNFAGRNIPILFLFFIIGLSAAFLYHNDITETGVGLIIRSTAQASILFFLLAFSASAFHFFFKNAFTNWQLKNRRYLGISFAISHYFHLIAILIMNFIVDKPVLAERGFVTVSLGGVAYVFLTLMALTSTDKAITKMGLKNWKILHWVGSHYIWVVFATSYGGRAFQENFYVLFAIALVLVMVFRIAHHFWKKK